MNGKGKTTELEDLQYQVDALEVTVDAITVALDKFFMNCECECLKSYKQKWQEYENV